MIALTSVGEAADKTRRPRARAACTRVCPPLARAPFALSRAPLHLERFGGRRHPARPYAGPVITLAM